MRLYKTKYKSTTGKTKRCKTWYIEFKDHLGLTHRIAADPNRDVTQDYGKKIEEIVRCRKLNQSLDTDQSRWVHETCPQKISQRLLEWNILGDATMAGNKPLDEYLKEYKGKLKLGFCPKLKSGCTDFHVTQVHNRVERIIQGCDFNCWNDINLEEVHDFLSRRKISEITYNYYARDFDQFIRWMLDTGRAVTEPKGKIPRIKVDKRHVRRPLTTEELRTLVEKVPNLEERNGLSGYERSILYLLAAETGFRAGELQRLRVHNFDLRKGTVYLEREKTKNRQYAEIPLKDGRIKQYRAFLDGREDDEPLFPAWWKNARGAEMIRADMKALDLKVVDPDTDLKADFHGLRMTFITALNATDAKVPESKTLARHSMKSDLTFGTYTVINPIRLRAIVNQLPDYGWPNETVKVQEKKTA